MVTGPLHQPEVIAMPSSSNLPVPQDELPETGSRSAQSLLKQFADLKFALDEAAIVAITDAEGNITYVNDTFCKISKYSREELLGRNHRIINSGYHPQAFFQGMWAAIRKGRVWRGEIKNRAKDGTYYWVDTTIVPFVDEQTGQPSQYIAIRKDITYLKRIEDELRLLNEGLEKRVEERTCELENTIRQLKESERMRETFVSALTHDLRTPLIAERRALDLLDAQKAHLPEKVLSLTERLIRNNEDLLALVNKLLETYQYESGRMRLLLEPVSLHALVILCMDKLAPLAQVKQIELINRVSPELALIPADFQQVQRVFINLLGNAVENVQEKGRLEISAIDQGNVVQVTVADNGPGIPADVLPHLFDRYFLVQQNKKKIGSGLGLSICKAIVTLHGGTIQVESAPGQGTTFFITLPKQQGE
jgi:PAS domain S-box-containing protein